MRSRKIFIGLLFRMAFLVWPFVSSVGSATEGNDLLAATHACMSVHRELPAYDEVPSELFERQGFLIAHSIDASAGAKASPALSFSRLNLADQDFVYIANFPMHRGPWHLQNVQIRIPTKNGDRDFCVEYSANAVLPDDLKYFTPAPDTGCGEKFKIIKAQVVVKEERLSALGNIQKKMAHDVLASARLASFLLQNPGRGTPEERSTTEKMSNLNLKSCEGLATQLTPAGRSQGAATELQRAFEKVRNLKSKASNTVTVPEELTARPTTQ